MAVSPDSPWAFVAVGRPVRGEFTYRVPEALRGKLFPGQRVRVPFGRQSTLGFYLAPAPEPSAEVTKRLKSIERPLEDEAALTPELVELLRFAAAHYRYPLGEAMRGAMPPGLSRNTDEKQAKADLIWWAQAVEGAPLQSLSRAPAQHATLSYLLAVGGRALVEEVAHAIPGAKATLKLLAGKGLVTLESHEVVPSVRAGLEQGRPDALTAEQQAAVTALTASLDAGGFSTFLLHGVTASGKTEVYLRLVEHALTLGKGALVLVPEIALTPQLVGRFKSRFGPQIAVLHSALKDRERLRDWQRLRKGVVKIAVGVRSAIWAPVANLGVIVVDEEHDPSFKQDEKLKYQARDLAVVRGQRASALVVTAAQAVSIGGVRFPAAGG